MTDLSQNLRSVLSEAHFETIECTTNKSKGKEYLRKSDHPIEKHQNLTKGKKTQTTTDNKSLLKPDALNLTNQEIPEHHLKLLNVEPTFFLALRNYSLWISLMLQNMVRLV